MKNLPMILLLLVIAFSGCKKKDICPNSVPGTIRDMRGLDGCAWVIQLDNGKRLEVINFADFNIALKDGKKVRLAYEASPMMGSICMVGEIVKVSCMVEVSGSTANR